MAGDIKKITLEKMSAIFNVKIEKDNVYCAFPAKKNPVSCWHSIIYFIKIRLDLKRQCAVREKYLDFELPM